MFWNYMMCTVCSAEDDEIKGATIMPPDWEGPGRARHWAPQVGSESRLNWRSMVDTSVLDARKHGPAFAHSITTELRLTCEAPSAKR